MKKRFWSPIVFIAIAAAIIFLDQLIKVLLSGMIVGKSIPILGNFVQIKLTHNAGMAFGLFQGQSMLSVWIAVIVIGLILYYYDEVTATLPRIGLALVLGGTIGNLIDRVLYNYVIDYIDIWIWPVFNVADIALTVGVALLILTAWEQP